MQTLVLCLVGCQANLPFENKFPAIVCIVRQYGYLALNQSDDLQGRTVPFLCNTGTCCDCYDTYSLYPSELFALAATCSWKIWLFGNSLPS